MGLPRQPLRLAVLTAALIVLAGCGGRGEEATTDGSAAQFRVEGGDNSVQEYGTEAPEPDLQQAATALHGFLDARAERDWAAACTYLGAETKRSLARGAGSADRGCAVSLLALSGKVPSATLSEAAVADVGSLRVQGDLGFLLYRGAPEGTVYAISMIGEAGHWKLASLAGVPLN